MSGEAAWMIVSKLFSLAILSGQPVSSPRAAQAAEANLKARYGPLIAAVEEAVERSREDLAIAEFEPEASYQDVPFLDGLVIEDRQGPAVPDQDPHYFKPGKKLRARILLGVRVRSSGEGFNLVLHVTARPRRSGLDALALAIAQVLHPGVAAAGIDIR